MTDTPITDADIQRDLELCEDRSHHTLWYYETIDRYARALQVARVRNNEACCLWCEHKLDRRDPEFRDKLVDHVAQCVANPLVRLLFDARTERDAARARVAELGQERDDTALRHIFTPSPNEKHLSELAHKFKDERDALSQRLADTEAELAEERGAATTNAQLRQRLAAAERERDAARAVDKSYVDLCAESVVDRLTPEMVEREPDTIKAWIVATISENIVGLMRDRDALRERLERMAQSRDAARQQRDAAQAELDDLRSWKSIAVEHRQQRDQEEREKIELRHENADLRAQLSAAVALLRRVHSYKRPITEPGSSTAAAVQAAKNQVASEADDFLAAPATARVVKQGSTAEPTPPTLRPDEG